MGIELTREQAVQLKRQTVSVMEQGGFKASLMKAPRLEDHGQAHGLPPGTPISVFPIAALPGAPESWLREAGTYVVPVEPSWGLWFDWTMNDHLNTAVLPSVKGMNPITGLKINGPRLESYDKRGPVHDEPLTHGNLCERCGYEWPPQNFVSAGNTLWWDGFRQPDGKVRQFFFTEDEQRDVASLVIGKENTVPAFGFVFYRPKSPRSMPREVYSRGVAPSIATGWSWDNAKMVSYSGGNHKGNKYMKSISNMSMDQAQIFYASSTSPIEAPDIAIDELISDGIELPAEVSVGAGAEIHQDLMADSLGLGGWQDEPAAIIRLYFCFQAELEAIIRRGGVKELVGNREGFLKGVPVG